MISLGARLVRAAIRLYTYPYRKSHSSLSRSVKLDTKPYKPKRGLHGCEISANGTRVQIISPERPQNANGAIVQFHGGGHTQPLNKIHAKAAARLAELTRLPVYSIDYKTGDELVYPSVHDECFAAFAYLLNGALKDKRVVAVGDSFGANLLLSACLRLRDGGSALPCAIVCASCYIDLAATGSSYEKNCRTDPMYGLPKNQAFTPNEKALRRTTPYCGDSSPFEPYLSPAFAEYSDFPKMLIQCGTTETSESDNDMLYEKARRAGVDVTLAKYDGMWHDFQYFTPFIKESKAAWKETSEFICAAIR